MFVLVENPLNIFLVLFPDIFLDFSYNFSGPSDYWYDKVFHISYSTFQIHRISAPKFLYFKFFQPPFVLYSYLMLLLRLSISKFYVVCNFYV